MTGERTYLIIGHARAARQFARDNGITRPMLACLPSEVTRQLRGRHYAGLTVVYVHGWADLINPEVRDALTRARMFGADEVYAI